MCKEKIKAKQYEEIIHHTSMEVYKARHEEQSRM
jgi:hypothetical protein